MRGWKNMDITLTAVQVILGLLMAYLGVEMTIHPPTTNRAIFFYRFSFISVGIIVVAISLWQAKRSADEQDRRDLQLAAATDALKAQLQANQVQSASDLGFMKGQLESLLQRPSDAKQLGEAIAASNTELIKAQSKQQSNDELAKAAIEYAAEMRSFEFKKNKEQSAILMTPYDPKATEQQAREAFLKMTAALTRHSDDMREEFRSKYLGQAVYLRNELLKRLGGNALPVPERHEIIAFDGFLAGPYPISAAADYLEQLARQLSPNAVKWQ